MEPKMEAERGPTLERLVIQAAPRSGLGAHTELPHRGLVVAAAALSAAEGSGSRRSAVYVGFPLCACAPYGRCEGAFFQGNRPIEQPKAPKIPVGSQSSRRLAALGALAA